MVTELQFLTEQSVEIAFIYSSVSTFTLIYKLYDIGLSLFSITNLPDKSHPEELLLLETT